jgi:hypothetical protein
MKHGSDGLDHYPDGGLHLGGGFAPKAAAWDLWFRTCSSPERAPEAAPLRSSPERPRKGSGRSHEDAP